MVTVCGLGQCLFFPLPENVACVLITAFSCMFTVSMMLRRNLMQESPLSTCVVLTWVLTMQIIPLCYSGVELRPITTKLAHSIETFTLIASISLTLILAHRLYRWLPSAARARSFISHRIFERVGLFQRPVDAQLWLLGFVGLGCLLFSGVNMDKSQEGQGGYFIKLFAQQVNLMYAPFLIPLGALFGREAKPISRATRNGLWIYTFSVFAGAIIRNDRSDFSMIAVILGFGLVLGVLCYRLKVKRSLVQKLMAWGVAGMIAIPLVTNLAIAMVYVRQQHSSLSAIDQAIQTIEVLPDVEMLDNYWQRRTNKSSGYDEAYYSSMFLNRFANVKFHDNALDASMDYSDEQRVRLQAFSLGNFMKGIPGPVVSILGLDYNKNDFATTSIGDYMYFLKHGSGLHTFRTGSFIAHGLALFSWFFFPIWGAIMIAYFILVDAFVRRQRYVSVGGPVKGMVAYSLPWFSPLALINLFWIFNPFRRGSFNEIPLFMLRELPTQIIFYWLFLAVTGAILRWMRSDRRTRVRAHAPLSGRRGFPVGEAEGKV